MCSHFTRFARPCGGHSFGARRPGRALNGGIFELTNVFRFRSQGHFGHSNVFKSMCPRKDIMGKDFQNGDFYFGMYFEHFWIGNISGQSEIQQKVHIYKLTNSKNKKSNIQEVKTQRFKRLKQANLQKRKNPNLENPNLHRFTLWKICSNPKHSEIQKPAFQISQNRFFELLNFEWFGFLNVPVFFEPLNLWNQIPATYNK